MLVCRMKCSLSQSIQSNKAPEQWALSVVYICAVEPVQQREAP